MAAALAALGCGKSSQSAADGFLASVERHSSPLTQLTMSGWVVNASGPTTSDQAQFAIDGNSATRWSNGNPQAGAEWFTVDMLSARSFNEIKLDAATSTGAFPAAYSVYVSNDGTTWGNSVASGTGSAQLTDIKFLTQSARYIKITQTGTSSTPWAIHELSVWLGAQPCDTAVCFAQDQCHTAGTCNPNTGTCALGPAVADNTACNDGNACTTGDVCVAGQCAGPTNVTCSPSDLCQTATCDKTADQAPYPTNGLIGLWHLDGNGLDASDGANDFSQTSAAVVPGKVGQAYRFTGTGSCFAQAGAYSNDWQNGTGISFVTWVNPAATCPGTTPLFQRGSEFGVQLSCSGTGAPGVSVGVNTGGGLTYSAPYGSVPQGQWSQVVTTWDGQSVIVYVNGQNVGSFAKNGSLALTPLSVYLTLGCTPTTNFVGALDEAAVYTRALTPGEVTAIAGPAPVCKSAPKCADQDSCHTSSCDPSTGTCAQTQKPAGASCSSSNPCIDSGATCTAEGWCQGGTPHTCAQPTDLCSQSTCDPYFKSIAASDYIAQWHMDGDFTDASGNGNDMTTGMSTADVVNAGLLGKAMHFGSSGSCTYRASGPNNNLNAPNGITFAAWVKPDAGLCPSSTVHPIIEKPGEFSAALICKSDNTIGFGAYFDTNGSYGYSYAAGTLPVGQWSHVAVVFYPRGGFMVYVNGVNVGSPWGGITNPIVHYSHTLDLGCGAGGGAGATIDEAILLRRTMTTDEIKRQYLSPALCSPAAPKTCATDACSTPGTCNPTTGACVNTPRPLGSPCNDNNACTTGDTCDGSGSCQPGTPATVSCTPTTNVPCQQNACDGAQEPEPPKNGMVAWWRLDGNTKDSGPNHLDLTNFGAQRTGGRMGEAYEFNGSTCIGLPLTDSRLDMSKAAGITMMAWVREPPGEVPPNTGGTIFAHGGDYSIETAWSSPQPEPGFSGMVTLTTSSGWGYPGVSGQVARGKWTHVAFTFDGTTWRMFENGVQSYGWVHAGTMTNIYNYFYIGCLGTYAGHNYVGSVDEVVLYNRALSSTEIQNYVTGTNTLSCKVQPVADHTACSDGNACTTGDQCVAGACNAGAPVTCTPGACQTGGTCNPTTGACSFGAMADGTACSDGNACTQTDVCQGGACTGSNPVTCTASDGCHAAGTCDPSSGTCSSPIQPGGACPLGAGPGSPTIWEPTNGMNCSEATGINNSGVVVGYSDQCTAPTWPGTQQAVAFTTPGGALQSLPLPTGTSSTFGAAISDAGFVVADGYQTTSQRSSAYIYRPASLNVAEQLPFPVPGGKVTGTWTRSDATLTVVGKGAVGTGPTPWQWASYAVPASGTGGAVTTMPPPDGYVTDGAVLGANRRGDLVGYYSLAGGTRVAMVSIAGGSPQVLATLIDDPLYVGDWVLEMATAINDNQSVVGIGKRNGVPAAFVMNIGQGTVAPLGTLDPELNLTYVPTAINSSGIVVGTAGDPPPGDPDPTHLDARRAFVFTETLLDLNAYVPVPDGWVLISAAGVNDSSQIAGVVLDQTTAERRAFKAQMTGLPLASVTPVLDGVAQDSDGQYLAVFGYQNTNPASGPLPSGLLNQLVVDGKDSSTVLPTWFGPTTHSAVVVHFTTQAQWTLGGTTVTAVPGVTIAQSFTNYGLKVTPPGGTPRTIAPNMDYVLSASDTFAADPSGSFSRLTVGKLNGDLGVTDDGATTYRVPLWVPPGRAGLQPELALEYNSRRGQGPYGIGWSLQGISRITRCNDEDVNNDGSVQDTPEDVVCLDGKRLRPVNTAGTEYRTQENEFAQIIRTGGLLNHTTFEVHRRDGRILTYGGTTATQTGTVGGQTVDLYWSLARIKDRDGNAITYDYENGDGEQWISTINYVFPGSGLTDPSRYVFFAYEDRSRPESGFSGNATFKLTKRLSYISMNGPDPSGDGVLRSYRLSYDASPTTGRDRLTSIQECDGEAIPFVTRQGAPPLACRRPTVFKYGDVPAAAPHAYLGQYPTYGGGDPPFEFRTSDEVGDINGDGKEDVVYQHGLAVLGTNFSTVCRLSDGTTLGPEIPIADIPPSENSTWLNNGGPPPGFSLVDVNGDGKSDVVLPDGTVYLSTTTGMIPSFAKAAVGTTGFPSIATSAHRYFGDIDGNGKLDLLLPPCSAETCTNSGWEFIGNTQDPPAAYVPYVIDGLVGFTGEAFAARMYQRRGHDLLLNTSNGWKTFSYDKYGTFVADPGLPAAGNFTGAPNVKGGYVMMDLNGDGLSEAVQVPISSSDCSYQLMCPQQNLLIDYYPNQAGTFGAKASTGVAVTSATAGFAAWVADYNQDGRDDLFLDLEAQRTSSQASLSVYTSNGHGFDPAQVVTDDLGHPIVATQVEPSGTVHYAKPIDINGDGRKDIVVGYNVYVYPPSKPDLLTGVTDGMAHDITVAYKPLSDTSASANADGTPFYTPGTDCGYPTACVNNGLWAVSRVSIDNGVEVRDQDPSLCTDCGTGGSTEFYNSFAYAYSGGRVSLTGEGWLGFEKRVVYDEARGLKTTTTFDNQSQTGFHWWVSRKPQKVQVDVTLPRHDTDIYSAALFNGDVAHQEVTENTYDVQGIAGDTTGGIADVFLKQVVETAKDSIGANTWTTRNQTTVRTFDADYGSEKTLTTTYGDGEIYERTTNYDDRPWDWIIGLPTLVTETSTPVNGDPAVTRTTHHEYDNLGHLQFETIEPQGDGTQHLERTYGYDSFGNVIDVSEVDAQGKVEDRGTIFDDDGMFPIARRDAFGRQTKEVHHPGLGVTAFTSDPNGATTVGRFDRFGRPKRGVDSNGLECTTNYALASSGIGVYSTTTTCADGRATGETFDRFDRRIDQFTVRLNGLRSHVSVGYDAFGRQATKSLPFFDGDVTASIVERAFDALDRPIRETYVSFAEPGRDVRKFWFYKGLETVSLDPLVATADAGTLRPQHLTVTNIRGKVTQSTDYKDAAASESVSTAYTYGAFGTLRTTHTASATQDGGTAVHEYDTRGREIHVNDPDTHNTFLGYDAWGNVTSKIDGDGNYRQLFYDQANRPTGEWSEKYGRSTITWDTGTNGVGRRAESIASPELGGATVSYGYDAAGNVTSEDWSIRGKAFHIGRTFVNGLADTTTFPASGAGGVSTSVKYNYDGASGALESISSMVDGTTYWRASGVDASGRLTSEDVGNGLTRTSSYEPIFGTLATVKTGVPMGTALQDLAMTFDGRGSLISRIDRGTLPSAEIDESYTYDVLKRLWNWGSSTGGFSMDYRYDDLGNRVSTQLHREGSGDGPLVQYNYGEDGAGPHQLTSAPSLGSYFYGLNGDQLSSPTQERDFTYFHLPRTITVGGQTATFDYTADEGRAAKDFAGNVTYYVGDAFEHADGPDGTRDVAFISGYGKVVGQLVLSASETAPTYETVLTDHLGTVVGSVKGGTATHLRYDPYGQRLENADAPDVQSAPGGVPDLGFAGATHDDELGLVNMQGRIYDPAIGRFLSSDPVVGGNGSTQAFSHYAYASNDPLSRIDPTGFVDTTPNSSYVPTDWSAVGQIGTEGAGSTAPSDYVQIMTPSATPVTADVGGYSDVGSAPSTVAEANISPLPPAPSGVPMTIDWVHGLQEQNKWHGNSSDIWGCIDGRCGMHHYLPEPGVEGDFGTLVMGATMLTGIGEGVAALEFTENEVFYRTMSDAHYNILKNTLEVQATGETVVTKSVGAALDYTGVTVEIEVRAGTTDALTNMGVRSDGLLGEFGGMYDSAPYVGDVANWTANNALLKYENGLVNIGLGNGAALDTFNSNIINIKVVPRP